MNKNEVPEMPDADFEREQQVKPVLITAEGLGFGEGSISVAARIEKGELLENDLSIAQDTILNGEGVFVAVDLDANDDGCGDGRGFKQVFRFNRNTNETETFNKSRRRAKLFGGGLVVAASMWRAVSGAPKQQETVYGDREFMAKKLSDIGIEFGAHTDNHAKGEVCGCGAIDKYPKITKNVTTYQPSIEATLKVLYGESYEKNEEAIEQVFGMYQQLNEDSNYMSNASGAKTMELIKEEGAVVKELGNDHLEAFVVLNDIDGTTLDQRELDEVLLEKGVKSEIQAFIVDTWRGRLYADAVALIKTGEKSGDEFESVRAIAYADFLIRTLAVSSELTAGDQQVIGRTRAGKKDYALAA